MEEISARHITFWAEEKAAGMAAYQEGRLTAHQGADGSIGDAYKIIEPTIHNYEKCSPYVQTNSSRMG